MHARLLQLCPTLCDPVDCSLPGSSVHGDSPGKNTGVGCHFPPGDLPDPGIELACLSYLLHRQASSLPLVPPETESRSVVSDSLRPHGLHSPWNSPGQNTAVGSLSLLQGGLRNPGIEPRSPILQVHSSPVEPEEQEQYGSV